MIEAMLLTGGLAEPGEMIFTTPGTYTVDVPLGVSRVSIVAVGAGGDGSPYRGGDGGALAFENSLDVSHLSVLQVTVGDAGTDSVVHGLLTAPGDGGTLTVPNGGVGGSGGSYRQAGNYGGGGGAAGRYGGAGGRGASVNSWNETNVWWTWQFIRSVPEGGVPHWSDYPFGAHVGGAIGDYPAGDFAIYGPGWILVVEDPDGPSKAYRFYELVRNTNTVTRYGNAPPTGTAGQGRGGGVGQDGEGVDLFGSDATPADNGYGYGGGRNRPGGQGAVRIIWGAGRAFPNNAGQAESETVEVY